MHSVWASLWDAVELMLLTTGALCHFLTCVLSTLASKPPTLVAQTYGWRNSSFGEYLLLAILLCNVTLGILSSVDNTQHGRQLWANITEFSQFNHCLVALWEATDGHSV